MGHWISFGVTMAMMLVVDYFMVKTLPMRKKIKNCWWRNGPMIMLFLATPMVLAEPTRHVMGDTGFWNWCGDNADYPRINQTWNSGCWASSTEYYCTQPCCVTVDELKGLGNYARDGPNASLAMYPMTTDGKETVPYDALAELYPNISEAYGIWHDHQFPQLDLSDPKYGDLFAVKNKTTGEITYECTCGGCVADEVMGNLSTVGWIFTFTLTYLGFAFLAVGSLWNADIIKKCKGMKAKWKQLRAQAKKNREASDLEQPLNSRA